MIVQSPNFFGIVENVKAAAEIAHRRGALLIVVFTEAVSLGILEPPAEADIVAGELQSFAISPSYGGPFAGILASARKVASGRCRAGWWARPWIRTATARSA